MSLASAFSGSDEEGSSEILSMFLWAWSFCSAEMIRSGGIGVFLGFFSLVRSTALFVALAADVSASLVAWRRTEKETED